MAIVGLATRVIAMSELRSTPNLPTKILPTKIRRLETSGKLPVDVRVLPLKLKIPLE